MFAFGALFKNNILGLGARDSICHRRVTVQPADAIVEERDILAGADTDGDLVRAYPNQVIAHDIILNQERFRVEDRGIELNWPSLGVDKGVVPDDIVLREGTFIK